MNVQQMVQNVKNNNEPLDNYTIDGKRIAECTEHVIMNGVYAILTVDNDGIVVSGNTDVKYNPNIKGK